MKEEREYHLMYPEEMTKNLNRLTLVLVMAFFFISAMVLYTPEAELTDVEPGVLNVDREVYRLGEIDEIDGYFSQTKITLDNATTINEPSMFFVSYDNINLSDSEKYNTLLDKGHLVLFVGYNLDPEKVAELFIEKQIPVVPIDSSIKLHYHSYGAVYSKDQDAIIPIIFASNVDGKINNVDFVELMNKISDEIMIDDPSELK